MNFSDEQYQNDFLTKWIYGKLTIEELNTFLNSTLYKNLVLSTIPKKDFIKES